MSWSKTKSLLIALAAIAISVAPVQADQVKLQPVTLEDGRVVNALVPVKHSKIKTAVHRVAFAAKHPVKAVYATGKWADDNHVTGALWLVVAGASVAKLFF